MQQNDQAPAAASAIESVAQFAAGAWLSAIIADSDDAILSKTLDGIITTWNSGASRLFGFTPEEAIGQPVTLVIPEDRLHEEDEILRRLRAGQRIDHFETIRRRKDGELIHISLTVSPIRGANGEILGASKIARDITLAKRAQAEQLLLLREMNHRIKNLFALASGLVTLSARNATSREELADDLAGRLTALARAHELTLPDLNDAGDGRPASVKLLALLSAILLPYQKVGPSITISGDDPTLSATTMTSVALILHELATNAAKYGALSHNDGKLSVEIGVSDANVMIKWWEQGIKFSKEEPSHKGFGSALEKATLRGIKGEIERIWKDKSLIITIRFPLPNVIL